MDQTAAGDVWAADSLETSANPVVATNWSITTADRSSVYDSQANASLLWAVDGYKWNFNAPTTAATTGSVTVNIVEVL